MSESCQPHPFKVRAPSITWVQVFTRLALAPSGPFEQRFCQRPRRKLLDNPTMCSHYPLYERPASTSNGRDIFSITQKSHMTEKKNKTHKNTYTGRLWKDREHSSHYTFRTAQRPNLSRHQLLLRHLPCLALWNLFLYLARVYCNCFLLKFSPLIISETAETNLVLISRELEKVKGRIACIFGRGEKNRGMCKITV